MGSEDLQTVATNTVGLIVLPPETGEQPSLSSGLSDAPWLNRRRPGSLYSIIETKLLLNLEWLDVIGIYPNYDRRVQL